MRISMSRTTSAALKGAPRELPLSRLDHGLRAATGGSLRLAARERGGSLPSIEVADGLLDERRELTQGGYEEATANKRHSPGTPLSA